MLRLPERLQRLQDPDCIALEEVYPQRTGNFVMMRDMATEMSTMTEKDLTTRKIGIDMTREMVLVVTGTTKVDMRTEMVVKDMMAARIWIVILSTQTTSMVNSDTDIIGSAHVRALLAQIP
jgi:hypothetical protein